jgi:hypothetical protein
MIEAKLGRVDNVVIENFQPSNSRFVDHPLVSVRTGVMCYPRSCDTSWPLDSGRVRGLKGEASGAHPMTSGN